MVQARGLKLHGVFDKNARTTWPVGCAGVACDFEGGPWGDAFYDIEVFNCGSVANCPGEDLTFSFADYGLTALSKQDLRVGHPAPPGSHVGSMACPEKRSGIACAVCEKGTYGTSGECLPCSGAAGGVNAIIVVVFPLAMLCLYRMTTSAGRRSGEGYADGRGPVRSEEGEGARGGGSRAVLRPVPAGGG